MARVVIADAGPLIVLARLDRLNLLASLFGTVVIPQAVHDECMAKDAEDSRRIRLAVDAGTIRLEGAEPSSLALPRSLGDGEKAALALAAMHADSLLILDDRLARKQAAKLGLAFIGTVRLLDIAERRGLIDDAEVMVEAIRKTGYRISLDILRRIRRQ